LANIKLFSRLELFNEELQLKTVEATKELIELKNFNESILQNISSGVITTDLDGKITFINRSAEEMILKYSSSEFLGKHLSILVGEKESQKMLQAQVAEELVGQEIELVTREGKRIFIGFSSTKQFDVKGNFIGVIISFRDITETKQMQAEVLRMDRLASLGVLSSGIAHEIKNPLAGIKTMAQALERELEPDDPRKEYLERIVRQVNRLDELLKTFFSYAKPQKPNPQACSLPAIVGEVVTLLGQKMRSQDIAVTENYPKDIPRIFVDFNQIEQVLFNLCLNAIEAMGSRGNLTISAKQVPLVPRVIVDRRKPRMSFIPKSYLEIKVSDTGPGIKPEDLDHIFNPFFTTKPTGTGLGLSIVYQIIKEHGGEIAVESQIGKGTNFTFWLPVAE
jgi:PAS domain S-box-containing protein